jgi:hypothetical protein
MGIRVHTQNVDTLILHKRRSSEHADKERGYINLTAFLSTYPLPSPELSDTIPLTTTLPRLRFLRMTQQLAMSFWCRPKRRMIALGKCLDDYVTHTALSLDNTDCANCEQGCWNRRCFAKS